MALRKWQCMICGFVYDEAEGWPDDNIAPGTRWEDVPEDWFCPDCGVGKTDFEMIDIGPAVPATAPETPAMDEELLDSEPDAEISAPVATAYRVWQCIICGFVYDEAQGWPDEDIAAGSRWEDVPEDWQCPDCGAEKGDFQMIEIAQTSAATPAEDAGERPPIVILGTGLAGYNLAREFRKLDQATPLLLITRDDGRAYTKPLLSTGFTQVKTADQLASAYPERMCVDLDLQVLTSTAVLAFDPVRKVAHTQDRELEFRSLVLAVGAQCIELPLRGDALERIYHVNDLEDYARFRDGLYAARRVLVIGAGLIGCEYANDLGNGGFEVDVVDPMARPLASLLPECASLALQRGLESLSTTFHFGVGVESVNHHHGLLKAGLSDGSEIEADAVLSAVGIKPRLDLARSAGLRVNRGIVLNRVLESSVPNIYALGDCAEVDGHVLNFVMPLNACARALARTLVGEPTEVHYGVMPVVVKTPVCPVVVSPPPVGVAGAWRETGDGRNVRALFVNESNQPVGFALTGERVAEREALSQQMPDIMSRDEPPTLDTAIRDET